MTMIIIVIIIFYIIIIIIFFCVIIISRFKIQDSRYLLSCKEYITFDFGHLKVIYMYINK